jgi:hypothetical protein
MAMTLPQGDLARCVVHERDDDWPTMIEIVAYFGEKRRKRRSIEIPADQFFGRGAYGAPITGDQLISIIDRMRRGKA